MAVRTPHTLSNGLTVNVFFIFITSFQQIPVKLQFHICSYIFSLFLSLYLFVFFPFTLVFHFIFYNVCMCVCLLFLFIPTSYSSARCVLVCCRHCSPVHYFLSVFKAHHWASLSVCLPHLHPKFQLFIYNQLVRYCTVISTFAPLTPQHLYLTLPRCTLHPHGTCFCSSTGTGPCVGGLVNDDWLNALFGFGFLTKVWVWDLTSFKFPGWDFLDKVLEWKLWTCPRKAVSIELNKHVDNFYLKFNCIFF